MSMVLGDIASLVGGQLTGDGSVWITGAAIIRDARAGEITFADNPSFVGQLRSCQASAVLVPPSVQPQGLPYITVENVHASFAKVVECFRPRRQRCEVGISAAAFVSETAKVGSDVAIHPGATIGSEVVIGARSVIYPGVRLLARCRLGQDVTIFPNAVLYEDTVVGDRVTIHAGSVIGAFGFGYETQGGRHVRSAQLGYVEIEDDVEIGACTTIDRGTYGPTRIGEGTKIDNHVMIAHNCRIGRHNLICSQVGIAGSCTTGDYVVLAGQVGLRDHVTVGSRAMVGAKAGVMNDIPEGGTFVGIPATPEREQLVKQAALARLPDLRHDFRALQKQVSELAAEIDKAARGEASIAVTS